MSANGHPARYWSACQKSVSDTVEPRGVRQAVVAAKATDPMWYAACCLAGEAGLRVGEIRALDWKRDVDLVAGTLTVNRQAGLGQTTTPKGRTRRTVPMTDTLLAALKALDTIRTGFVIRNLDGTTKTDNETKYHCYRICRAAGLPERGWHILRHGFGTHAAMSTSRRPTSGRSRSRSWARSEVTTTPTRGSSRCSARADRAFRVAATWQQNRRRTRKCLNFNNLVGGADGT
jgi:integrase